MLLPPGLITLSFKYLVSLQCSIYQKVIWLLLTINPNTKRHGRLDNHTGAFQEGLLLGIM